MNSLTLKALLLSLGSEAERNGVMGSRDGRTSGRMSTDTDTQARARDWALTRELERTESLRYCNGRMMNTELISTETIQYV